MISACITIIRRSEELTWKAASDIRKLWEIPTIHLIQQLWSKRFSRDYCWQLQLNTVLERFVHRRVPHSCRELHIGLQWVWTFPLLCLPSSCKCLQWPTWPWDHKEKGTLGNVIPGLSLGDAGNLWVEVGGGDAELATDNPAKTLGGGGVSVNETCIVLCKFGLKFSLLLQRW